MWRGERGGRGWKEVGGRRGKEGLSDRGDNFSNDMEVGNNTMCTDTYLNWIIIYELRNGY